MHPDDEKTPEQEVTEELLALIAFFVDRLYGPRVAQRDYSKQTVQCGAASQVISVTSLAFW